MSPSVLALVLLAAACHALWNLLAKGAEGGTGFVWLGNALAVALYLPVALAALVIAPGRLDWAALGAMAVSGALHAVYFVLLQRGYRDGDLSVVYPLARGTAPIVATLIAIAALGERPGPLALAGAAMIAASVLSLARSGAAGSGARLGVAPALGTGMAIGLYTVWDKHAVSGLMLSPIVYYWGTAVANVLVLSPYAARHPDTVRLAWRSSRSAALGVGLLSPLAYVLVLFALVHAPVAYVAPARETSIVMASVLGALVLGEGESKRRLLAAAGVLAGVVALALA